jgi:hypothetical protein
MVVEERRRRAAGYNGNSYIPGSIPGGQGQAEE